MKKLIYSLLVVLSSATSFSQNVEVHDAKVIGSFDLGTNEITTILDEITGCIRRTAPHLKNLFTPDELVQIRIPNGGQLAEVLKTGLPEQVYVNKDCGRDKTDEDLVLSDEDLIIANGFMEIIKLSFLDLTNDSDVRNIIETAILDSANHEKISISYIEEELTTLNKSLLELLENSLVNHGGTTSDVNSLANIYFQFEISQEFYDIFIYIPFSDEVNYDENAVVASFLNGRFGHPTNSGLKLNNANNAQTIVVNQGLAMSNPVWVLSLSLTVDHSIYKALPWQKCHCTRSGINNDGNISTQGKCSKKGTCGFCGRANIFGNCPSVVCPGC